MFYRFISDRRKAIDLDNIHSGSCFVVGGSPYLKEIDLEELNKPGVISLVMNNAAVLARPNIWIGADKPENYSKSILYDNSFMKINYLSRVNCLIDGKKWKDLPNTFFVGSSNTGMRSFFNYGRDFVWAKNVFMLTLQIAYRLGFRTVYTLGCSFKINENDQYAYGSKLTESQVEYNARTYNMVINQFREIMPYFVDNNFEVISCTPDSALNEYVPYKDYKEAINHISKSIPSPDTINVVHPLAPTEFPNEQAKPEISKHYLMALEHRKIVLRTLPESGRMLEWGSGDSSIWFRKNMKPTQELVSIEHDEKYAALAGAIHIQVEAGKNATIDEEKPGKGANDYVWAPLNRKLGKFDVILVDGICRNMCLMTAKSLLKPGGTVFLHDAHRDWYEVGKGGYVDQKTYDEEPDYKGTTLWEGKLPS